MNESFFCPKDRGRHYCIGTHLSTNMADSVKNRVVPAVPTPSALYCTEEVPTHGEVGRTKPCVNMLLLPLQRCTVEDMAKAKVLSERTASIPIKKITPVIDEEHHSEGKHVTGINLVERRMSSEEYSKALW